MVVRVGIGEEEALLFRRYAEAHGIPLSKAFKEALLERIEDEQDASDLNEALLRFKNPATYSLDDLRKVYDCRTF